MANVVYEIKKPSLIKRGWNWGKEHADVVALTGTALLFGIVGFKIGRSGVNNNAYLEGVKDAGRIVAENYPKEIDKFGFIGASAAYDHIMERFPDLKNDMASKFDYDEVSDIFYENEEVQSSLANCKKLAKLVGGT